MGIAIHNPIEATPTQTRTITSSVTLRATNLLHAHHRLQIRRWNILRVGNHLDQRGSFR